jgi:hypothetical protein
VCSNEISRKNPFVAVLHDADVRWPSALMRTRVCLAPWQQRCLA